jgi:hypothetical protein
MAREKIANPFAAYTWFAEAGWVFAVYTVLNSGPAPPGPAPA